MKLRICMLIPLALCGAAASAQDIHTTTYDTPQGEVIVNWGQPAGKQYGAPPSFNQLAHSGYISSDDAVAYPPLANDFIHADSNRDGRVSKAEYERWARHQ